MKPNPSLLIKPFVVYVRGHIAYPYYATSRGKAFAQAFYSYTNTYNTSFAEFLKIANIRGATPDQNPFFGTEILVSNERAFFIAPITGGYIKFAYPNDPKVLVGHPQELTIPDPKLKAYLNA